MRFFIFGFVLFLGACANQPNSVETGEPSQNQVIDYAKADADYLALAQKIMAQEASGEDFDRIIRLFPLTSFYQSDPAVEEEFKQTSLKQMQNNQWFPCLRTNRQLININYTSLTGHYGMAICSQEARDYDNAKFHNWALDSFIEAIWRSGNGQTSETPFYINSVADLIAFVQLHQLQVISQSLEYENNRPIQKVRVQNPENLREYDWYFDMTAQFRRAYIEKLEAN